MELIENMTVKLHGEEVDVQVTAEGEPGYPPSFTDPGQGVTVEVTRVVYLMTKEDADLSAFPALPQVQHRMEVLFEREFAEPDVPC